MNNRPKIFLAILEERMDYPCQSVQDGIDRIISQNSFRGRATFLAWLQEEADHPTASESVASFRNMVAMHSKDEDLLLVTGYGRDFWMG